MRIEYDGKTLENNYLYGMVTNATSVAKLLSLSDVEWDDGLFEVSIIFEHRTLLSPTWMKKKLRGRLTESMAEISE